ncbi:MAG: J domain-containing protein, partial [Hyphomicrobiales bacterium]|nr:J domain-containing protein [Hyphomicrobiales bacterium]
FDRGEIDAEGKPKFQGFEGFNQGAGRGPGGAQFRWSTGGGPGGGRGGFDTEDILREIFGGRAGFAGGAQAGHGRAGEDIAVTARVSLEEVVRGDKIRVQLPNGRKVDVNLPAGSRSGRQIRLKGQGGAGMAGGPPGDAIVSVEIVAHPLFAADGDDLRLDLPITLDEAVLGGKVRTPTLTGMVELTVPAGSSAGRTLRLKGKGLPRADGGHGDLLVSLRIMLPEGGDDDLADLMQRWRKAGRYSVRGAEYER